MAPSIHIRALDLRCPPGLDRDGRQRLAIVATRELPTALARATGAFDHGRLVFVRRLDVRARLHGGSDQAAAARWADAIAAALHDRTGDVVVFDRPIDALVAFVEMALGERPGERIGRWPWVPSVLEAARSALASLPALDGSSHSFAIAPPLPGSDGGASLLEPGVSIAWALVTAGALLPSLVAELVARDLAAAALSAVAAPMATAIVDRLVGSTETAGAASPVVSRVAAAITAWPSSDAADPRNQLLVAALVLEQRPSLRGTPALASVRSIAYPVGAPVVALVAPAAALPPVLAGARPESAVAIDHGPVAAAPVTDAAAERTAPARSIPDPGPMADAVTPTPLPPAAPDAATPARRAAGSKTAFAGLLCLLDPIHRIELPAAIVDEPALATDPGLPALLYGTVCRLLPDAWADPCALALTDEGAPQAPATVATAERLAAIDRASTRLAAAAARLPATPHAADAADAAAHAAAVPFALPSWLDRFCTTAAAHVAAHLRARLASGDPLPVLAHKLAARPGMITVTRTHIDVTLDLADVDLDVRRAALDINPGWVPFLGRIVHFHYL